MKQIFAIIATALMVMAVAVPTAIAPPTSGDSSATLGNTNPVVTGVIVKQDGTTLSPATSGETGNLAYAYIDSNTGQITDVSTDFTIEATVADVEGISLIVSVVAKLQDSTGTTTIQSIQMSTLSTEGTSALYTGTLTLPHDFAPGTYRVTVTATDSGDGADPATLGIGSDYTDFIIDSSIGIDVSDMSFGTLSIGQSNDGTHSVANLGNVALNFTNNSANDWECTDVNNGYVGLHYYDGDNTDGISWINFDGPGTETLADDYMITTYSEENSISINTVGSIGFKLYIPVGTMPGCYEGTTTFSPSAVV